MVPLIISFYIISLFVHQAKEQKKNTYIWGCVGFISYWIPTFGLILIIDKLWGEPNSTWEYIYTYGTKGIVLLLGFFFSQKIKSMMITNAKKERKITYFQRKFQKLRAKREANKN